MNLFKDKITEARVYSFHAEKTTNQNTIQLVYWLLFIIYHFTVSWMHSIWSSISFDSKYTFPIILLEMLALAD